MAFSPEIAELITSTASQYGIDPDYMARMAQIESGGRADAFNRSGASGLFQFIPSTWEQYGKGADVFDPKANADAAARFTLDNKNALAKALGRDPTPDELYLAHQQGSGGATKLLTNPDAPAASLVGRGAVVQNGGRADMTAGEFASMWRDKYAKIGGGSTVAANGPGEGALNPAPASGGNSPIRLAMRTPMQTAMTASDAGNPLAQLGTNLGFTNAQGAFDREKFGDMLVGVGAALMARDKPEAAAALMKIAQRDKKTNEPQFDTKTGQMIITGPQGPVAVPIPGWKKEAAQFSAKDQELFTQYNDKAASFYSTAEQANRFRDMIMNGELKLDNWSRIGSEWRNFMGSSDPQSRNLAEFGQFLESARNNSLLMAKGTQTEGDAKRAMDTILSSSASKDDAATLKALDQLAGAHRREFNNNTNYARTMLKRNDGEDATPYEQTYTERQSALDAYERDYTNRRDFWLRGRDAKVNPAAKSSLPQPDENGVYNLGNGVTMRKR